MTNEVQVDVETGIWHCEKDAHSWDDSLADALIAFFKKENAHALLDIGCGSGDYVELFRLEGFLCIGIDGNPRTKDFCDMCLVGDLSKPYEWHAQSDWSVCLEVGEHIPTQFEQVFIDNVCKSFTDGIVISWFPTEGHGIGHFNPRPNEYVKEQFLKRGFVSDEAAQKNLRDAASLWWFKESLMVFRRI